MRISHKTMSQLPIKKPHATARIQKNAVALIATALVHICMGLLLWWGATWVQVKPTEVGLWSAGGGGEVAVVEPAVSVPEPEPESTPTPVAPVVNQVAPPVVQEQADVQLKQNQKPSSSQKQPDPVTPPKITPNRPNDEAAKRAQKQKEDAERRADLLKTMGGSSNGSSGSSGSSGSNGSSNAEISAYMARVRNAINAAGRGVGLAEFKGTLTVKISNGGAIRFESASGATGEQLAKLKQVSNRVVNGPPASAIGQTIRYAPSF
jgi:hypothetical protein